MTEEKKYRVHDLVKFNYSEIGEYIGEGYTDKPLRNDEIVDLLNENERLKKIIEDHIQRYLNLKNVCNNCMIRNEQLEQKIQNMEIRFKRKYDHEFDEIVDELDEVLE